MASTKDALHRLVEAIPDDELERVERLLRGDRLPERLDLATLIAQQQFRPIVDPLALAVGIWPDDEDVDDFLNARESWRHEYGDA